MLQIRSTPFSPLPEIDCLKISGEEGFLLIPADAQVEKKAVYDILFTYRKEERLVSTLASYLAHSPTDEHPEGQLLSEHLKNVSLLSAAFSESFGENDGRILRLASHRASGLSFPNTDAVIKKPGRELPLARSF